MIDLVGGLSKPRALPDVQKHFRSKGYDVVGNAVFDDSRAKHVAEEYGLPIIQDAERLYIVNDGR